MKFKRFNRGHTFDFPREDIPLLIAIVGNLDSEWHSDENVREMVLRCQGIMRDVLAHRSGVKVPPLHH